MADEEDKNKKQDEKEGQKEKKSFIKKILPFVIMIIFVGVCAGAGFGLGKILAGTSAPNADANEISSEEAKEEEKVDFSADSDKFWYYNLEPAVVANLNEPGVTRYISASLTLQMSVLNEKEMRVFLDEKTPILRNWLYLYLSGLSIANIQGDKNLKSIQSQICDGFNKELFGNSKPQIKQILIREFPIQ
jgi:flagellar basal body-associated protein FliL